MKTEQEIKEELKTAELAESSIIGLINIASTLEDKVELGKALIIATTQVQTLKDVLNYEN
jgi:hypothetical protein